MKKSIAVAAVVLLAACGPATSEESGIGVLLGKLPTGDSVQEFKTKSGVHCVYVSGTRRSGLACDFKGVEK